MATNNSTLLYLVKNNKQQVTRENINSGKYYYPSSMLDQPYFVSKSTAKADLTLGMLAHEKFESPALQLLKEMHKDGHDVSAVFDEVQALYCIIKQQVSIVEQIRDLTRKAMF